MGHIIVMTPGARLQAVLDIMETLDRDSGPADVLIGAWFRSHRYAGAKDRAAIADMVYGLLKHRARLEWWCEHYHVLPSARARLLVYLCLVAAEAEPAILQNFSAAKFSPTPLDEEEIRLLRRLRGHTLIHPTMAVPVRYELPVWILPLLQGQFGSDLDKECAALLEAAPLDVRVNTLKTERDPAIQELQDAGVAAHPCHYSPWGVRLGTRVNLPSLTVFKEGKIEVQDEGSQLAALLVDAQPGMRVADFCAGAGGKTLALAASMANKGRITAFDVVEKRLRRGTERFRRAGVHNVETRVLDGENTAWLKRHKDAFDRVLVDAPCSGTGTWRRNPDARWKLTEENLKNLQVLQGSILAEAARLVKPGGRLVYVTCSMLDVENKVQISLFLNTHENFTLVPYERIWRDKIQTPLPNVEPMLQLTPARHGTDGFFVAVMERHSA